MTDVVVAVVVGLVIGVLAIGAVRLGRDADARTDYVATLRAIRWWMWPAAVVHIACIVGVVVFLLQTFPSLRLGWWMMLGGSGNIALGQTGRAGAWWNVVALAIPVSVCALVPYLAHQEEIAFRYGSELDSRWAVLRRQSVFGIGHSIVMGVPIAAGLTLIGSGVLYDAIYTRALSRYLSETDLVPITPEPHRLDYPPYPQGPYDPAVWEARYIEFTRINSENNRLRKEWTEQLTREGAEREEQIDELRRSACATAAAFHSCTNWIVIGVLMAFLIATT